MKATPKQKIALENLAEFLGEKPPKVKTVQEADTEIKALIARVKEFESEISMGGWSDYF